MATDPLWLPSTAYDETEFRKMDMPLVMADGTALGGRGGIRPGDPGLAVTLAGTTVNVSAGVATLPRANQGLYRAQIPASSPGSLTAANATFSRIDLVYLRVWDTAVDSSGFRKADPVYLAGTAQAVPVAPTPGGTEIYIPLATITVPSTGGGGTGAATVSSTIRQLTVAPGGILPVNSAADIALAGVYAGQARYNGVRGVVEYWNGTTWLAPGDAIAYTPTWTASTTNPTLNNGTLSATYAKQGSLVTYQGSLVLGSTTNGGTGIWAMSLPFPPVNAVGIRGVASYIKPGDNEYLGASVINVGGLALGFVIKTQTSYFYQDLTNTAPVSAASGNQLLWAIQYWTTS
ncbi:hypothetical protein [Streptomyces sp. CB03911]|uniref:hypothetical protein n=1 Tax=Streptomyces sp. CB03911 TaxID=1804758 RepID=UPI000938BD12|nr:hypothetical protein [Streptomyces sp. CB03911]OKI22199.1 hypothetical protein A6A07_34555 [Streptomyces sp. CB03911]